MEGAVIGNGVHTTEGKGVRVATNGSTGSVFENVKLCPPDAIFNVKNKYVADKSPNKVNLGVGGELTSRSHALAAEFVSCMTIFLRLQLAVYTKA